MAKLRVALCISGAGSTMEHILWSIREGQLKGVEPACVIASRFCHGLLIAKTYGWPCVRIPMVELPPRKEFASAEAYGGRILSVLGDAGVDLVGLYGWMPLMPANVVERYAGRIINQHPGPLDPGHPDFGGQGMYGRRVHCARLLFVRRAGVDPWTEVVTHRVTPEYDRGEVIGATTIPIAVDDEVETVHARAIIAEHRLQVRVLQDFADGIVMPRRVNERLVRPEHVPILEEAKKAACLLYPRG